MRTKNNSLILKTTLWVLANQISFFKNILMNDNTKTRFIRRSKYNTKKYSRISEPERSSRKKSVGINFATDCGGIVDSFVRDSGWIRQNFELEKKTLMERFVGFLHLNIRHASDQDSRMLARAQCHHGLANLLY